MTQIVTSVVSLLLLCLLRFFFFLIRHQQKSPTHSFVNAGNLAKDQTSYSAPNAIFKPLSLQQIDNGSNLSPNRKQRVNKTPVVEFEQVTMKSCSPCCSAGTLALHFLCSLVTCWLKSGMIFTSGGFRGS